MSKLPDTTETEYVPDKIGRRLRLSVKTRGIRTTAWEAASWSASYLAGPRLARARREADWFQLGGRRYRYLDSRTRWTWLNERAVEVPVIADAIAQSPGARVLELGNVMGQYGIRGHRVIDLYDTRAEAENIDVLELSPDPRYDLVISVSTLEHIRWDERPRDPDAAVEGIRRLKSQLSPGGRLLATIPVGYHPFLELQVIDGTAGFDEVRALARTSSLNAWTEVDVQEALSRKYDWLVYSANAVLFAEVTAPRDGPP